jgi:CTP synthase (UTP-ammonia lyase)
LKMTQETVATMSCPIIALVGDFSDAVPAHRAIPRALELAVATTQHQVTWRWVHTSQIRKAESDLADAAAVWAVPASPYANMDGVLDSIRWARETGRPFLGTCGGFQHALIEFARNVAGLVKADHAETSPDAELLLIDRLSCSLVEKTAVVRFVSGSRLSVAYGSDNASEGYHCNYGLNSAHRRALERAGLRFTAFDDADEVRAFELPAHPFFIGTLFQPERAALRNERVPLVNELVRAVATRRRE